MILLARLVYAAVAEPLELGVGCLPSAQPQQSAQLDHLKAELASAHNELAVMRARYEAVVPSHLGSLQRLKALGFSPAVIYDIGAATGGWTRECQRVFPHAMYHLFEPSRVYTPMPDEEGLTWHREILFHSTEMVEWYSFGGSGDSMLRENTKFFENVPPTMRQAHRLDHLVAERQLPLPQLLKLDTQGSEVHVLRGALAALGDVEVILLELPLAGEYNAGRPSLAKYVGLLEALGYEPFDLAEAHLTDGLRLQFDLLFVRVGGQLARHLQAKIAAIGVGSQMEQHLPHMWQPTTHAR